TITCPITDADSPNEERILDTAASLGIHHYWWGTFRYDRTMPVMAQLEALKPRVAKLAALNAKYGMKAMYHTYSGAGTVGAAFWRAVGLLGKADREGPAVRADASLRGAAAAGRPIPGGCARSRSASAKWTCRASPRC